MVQVNIDSIPTNTVVFVHSTPNRNPLTKAKDLKRIKNKQFSLGIEYDRNSWVKYKNLGAGNASIESLPEPIFESPHE